MQAAMRGAVLTKVKMKAEEMSKKSRASESKNGRHHQQSQPQSVRYDHPQHSEDYKVTTDGDIVNAT